MDNEVEEAPHLPAEVVKKISGFCLDGEPNPASRLLLLLSMCGVCKSWRQMCSEVAAGVTLAFDGMESAPPAPGGMMMTRFRRTPAWKKTAVFEAAAKLLTGERGDRRGALGPHSAPRRPVERCHGPYVRSVAIYATAGGPRGPAGASLPLAGLLGPADEQQGMPV